MPHTYIKPARIVYHSTPLMTDVVRGVGWKPRCSCGWIGSLHEKHGEAQWEAKVHRHKEHKQ